MWIFSVGHRHLLIFSLIVCGVLHFWTLRLLFQKTSSDRICDIGNDKVALDQIEANDLFHRDETNGRAKSTEDQTVQAGDIIAFKDNNISRHDAADAQLRLSLATTTPDDAATVQHNDTTRTLNTKPNLVLHVGPPKTATTTIQCSLRKHQNTLLNEDSYHVLETQACKPRVLEPSVENGHGNIYNCFNALSNINQTELLASKDINASIIPTCWKEYERVLDKLKKEGKHVIISNEVVARTQSSVEQGTYIPFVVQSLQDRFHIVIVIAYRRWFEWIPSVRSELYKPQGQKPRLYMWPRKRPRRNGGGGRLTPTFEEFFADTLETGAKFAYANTLLTAFRDHVQDIRILNVHDETQDVETNFYCNVLPTAQFTCECFRQSLAERFQHQNTAVELNYDMLSTWAYLHDKVGDVGIDLGRREVAWRASNFHKDEFNETTKDFPKVCPPQTLLDRILNRSLELEQKVMPPKVHAAMQTQHVSAFESKVMTYQLFCTVDAERVLRDKKWQDFFRSNMTLNTTIT